MTMSIRATAALTALLALAGGCTPSGFLVNGKHVADEELTAYQRSWQSDSTTATSNSLVLPYYRQHILNLIAHQEATDGTKAGECSSLTLAEVIPLHATHLRVAQQTFGPLKFIESWRVLACGNKHSWFVFEDRGISRQPTAIYMQVPNGDWAQFERTQP